MSGHVPQVPPCDLEQKAADIARELGVPSPTVVVDLKATMPQGKACRTRRHQPLVRLSPGVLGADRGYQHWVVAHEVGHVRHDRDHRWLTRSHDLLRSTLVGFAGVVAVSAVLLGRYSVAGDLARAAVALTVVVASSAAICAALITVAWSSRRWEHAADLHSTRALIDLGHDGVGLLGAAMAQPFVVEAHEPGLLASHPSPADRLAYVQSALGRP